MSRSAGTGAGAPEASAPRRPEPRALLLGAAHLTGLCAFAISQPLFDLLAKGPEFFATRGSTGLDILLFALAATLGPPALMLVAELVAWLVHSRLRSALHSVFIAGLVALIAVQLLKKAGADGVASVAILVSLLAGAGVAYGYWRRRGIRAFLTVLAPASLLFLVLFLVFSPVSELTVTTEAHARGDAIRSRTPVVMVVFDEFPSTSLMDERRRVDELRYPGFAALARDATWYRNATGVHDSTAQAVPAILDAKYPVKGRLPVPSGHPDNVFTLFGEGGYRMNVNEDVTKLCTRRLCPEQRSTPFAQRMRALASDLSLVYLHLVLPEDLERKLPSVSETWGDFRGGEGGGEDAEGQHAEETEATGATAPRREKGRKGDRTRANLNRGRVERFDRWVAAVGAGREPSFNFIHTLLPHVPWQYVPSGKQYRRRPPETVPGMVSPLSFHDPTLVTQAYQRHLLQAGLADRLLGRLLRRLRETGLYDRALVVVLADHGVAFDLNANRRKITPTTIEDVAPVPLFVKAPHQRRGRVSDAYVETVDVLPTMADVLDFRLPWSADGRSASSAEVRRRRSVRAILRSFRTLVVDAGAFERRKAAALRRKLQLFGAGDRGPGLYGIGPHRDLLGRRVVDLPVARSPGPRAVVNGVADLRSVDPGSPFLPVHVTGRIEGWAPRTRRDVAIAVNGRIAAVSRSFSLLGSKEVNFSGIVPDSALRAGANRVEVLSVSPEGRPLRLESLGGV